MLLLHNYLKSYKEHLGDQKIRIRIIGDLSKLSSDIQTEVAIVLKETEHNNGLTLNIALNYGSRCEIVSAVKLLVDEVETGILKKQDINEEIFSNRLYTKGIPDPDLLIRPGGEKRISNFLLWQTAYTEFYYTDVLWPDFKKNDIITAIYEYQNRNRRYGGIDIVGN